MGLAAQMYKPSRFRLEIPELPYLAGYGPNKGGNPSEVDTQMIFSVENVFFPSRNISSEPFKTAGPVSEVAYESTYSGDLDITMRLSGDFIERQYFERWMDATVNRTTQEFSYPDSYQCEAFLHAQDYKGKDLYVVRLTEVWPKGIGQVSVGQGLTDTIATMQVQLSFRRYFVDEPPTSNPPSANEVFTREQEIFIEKVDDPTSEFNAGSDFNPDFL